MIYFLDPICIMRRPRRVTPETAIFEGLETLLRLARDARAGGGEQDPVAVVGSVVGVFFCRGRQRSPTFLGGTTVALPPRAQGATAP